MIKEFIRRLDEWEMRQSDRFMHLLGGCIIGAIVIAIELWAAYTCTAF